MSAENSLQVLSEECLALGECLEENSVSFLVPEHCHGKRLDVFLSTMDAQHSRTRFQQLITQGCVACNAHPVDQPSRKVLTGQTYDVVFPSPVPWDLSPEEMALDILYEDADILVLNKPAGLVVHPGPGHAYNTLVHGLLWHCGESLSGISGLQKPGIVHRLDKETSGVMVVAKHDYAHQQLCGQFSVRQVQKVYWAFVHGAPVPRSGTIENLIGRHPKHRQKMAIVQKNGKTAITQYRVTAVSPCGTFSWVSCILKTGRTHQLRVHLASLGHAILGDEVYGPSSSSSLLGKPKAWIKESLQKRHALHAQCLSFHHPVSGKFLSFQAPLPQALAVFFGNVQPVE